MSIGPSWKKFVYPYIKGQERWDLQEISAKARKDVFDGIGSSRTRGQITKCVRRLRWAWVEGAWPLIKTSTAPTQYCVRIMRNSDCNGWFASTSKFGSSTIIGNSEDLTLQLAIAHKDDSTRHLSYKVRTTVINQGNLSCTHKRIHNKTKLKPNTNHRWTTMPQTLLFQKQFVLPKITRKRVSGCIWREHRYEWVKISI